MQDLPHGTVTFLFTDIEGSTRLWHGHPDTMPDAYARHDAILREVVAAHGGAVFKTIGDAFQIAFATPIEALLATTDAQLALQAERWPLPEQLKVRMALHTGAVDPDSGGDYRSPVLNRLGRLLGAAHGAQVLVSQATMELTRDHLPSGMHLRDLGEQRLKDLFRPERVYQVEASGLLSEFPPLRTLDARPNNLPLQPTPFIGREQVVTEARTVLAQPEVRLLTLTGPGGMGKTRLGLQLAADLLDQFADGVYVVELAALTDPGLVPTAIGTVLGVEDEGGKMLRERLQEFLREKQLLLVLDNFEQIVDAAPVVAKLLAGCRDLKVLVTSRIRLGLRGERDFDVPSLALPDPQRLPSIDQMTQYDAVRLFVERAVEAKSNFEVTNANAPAVAEICVRLDGLPLAIELAAARVRMLPPQAMLARLKSRLPLLTGGARDLPERHQTLRGAIAWSHELLAADEQALFRRLAVFAGGCTLDAVAAVAAGDELDFDIFDGLERLVDHSLLRQTEDATGEPRFGMLETIREYGLEQLENTAEADEAHQRHAGFFQEMVEAAEPSFAGGPEHGAWLDRLETEHDNLRAALRWTLEHEPETALRIAGGLGQFWQMRGYLSEGRAWVDAALAKSGEVQSAFRASVLLAAGHIALWQADSAVAMARLEEALVLARVLGETEYVVRALNGLGAIANRDGDTARAAALFEECLPLAREIDSPFFVGAASCNLGIVAAQQGDLDRATRLLEEALALAHAEGDQYGESLNLINLGQVALARYEWKEASELLREGTAKAVAMDSDEGLIADGVASMGVAAGLAGQPAVAARLFGAAEAMVEAIGSYLDPVLPTQFEQTISVAKEALGDAAYAAARETGQVLSREEAVAEALGVCVGDMLPAGRNAE